MEREAALRTTAPRPTSPGSGRRCRARIWSRRRQRRCAGAAIASCSTSRAQSHTYISVVSMEDSVDARCRCPSSLANYGPPDPISEGKSVVHVVQLRESARNTFSKNFVQHILAFHTSYFVLHTLYVIPQAVTTATPGLQWGRQRAIAEQSTRRRPSGRPRRTRRGGTR